MPNSDNIRPEILIIEDDEGLRELLEDEIRDMALPYRSAASVEQARSIMADQKPSVVITDVRLPGMSGLDLLRHLQDEPGAPSVIVITAFGTIRQAVEALRMGASDFLTKPLDLDHLRIAVDRTLDRRRLEAQVKTYREALTPSGFHGIIGQSEPVRRLIEEVRLVARAEGPVLITGESGTGKELVARALHAETRHSDGPFIAVNCAGVPAELLESEFFGYEKGAFTGARTRHAGLFVDADGGTLLLDEIAEMPIALQAKLLRVLQEGRVRAVGSTTERDIDVRIIASTNRDLEREMEQGSFREDLFYRLETFQVKVPPLRDRIGDVELLAAHFLQRHAMKLGRTVPEVDPAVFELINRYPFPGNVRELENAIERTLVFAGDGKIRVAHLPVKIREYSRGRNIAGATSDWLPSAEKLLPLEEVERRYILHVLEKTGGNKRQAAAILGVARRTLYRKLDEYEATAE